MAMRQSVCVVALVLATSVAVAQTATTSPTAGGKQTKGTTPPGGGASIPSDLRRNASKDVPMGEGKPKNSTPSAGNDKRGK
jgi:hypothetical protein